ncbi:hypothetical protein MyNCGM683_11990 [Achromobacter xylosoxidans]
MQEHPLDNNIPEREYFRRLLAAGTGLGAGAYRRAVRACTGGLPAWAAPNRPGRKPAANAKSARAAQLDWELGRLLRVTERMWPALCMEQRRDYADEFIRLEAALQALTGKADITSPWTGLELADSLSAGAYGYCYTGDALDVYSAPLMVAVRRTKITLAKTGRLPASLNSKRVPVPGLAVIDHAYSVEEVRQLRAQRISVSSTSAGNTSASAQEREWAAKAEARILPR